jgi:cell division protein FtsQ
MGGRSKKRPKKARKNRSTRLKANISYVVFMVLPMILFVVLAYFVTLNLRASFQVKNVTLNGNDHLTDQELRQLSGISNKDNLITLSSKNVFKKMVASPWIRSIAIRKEFPDTLHMYVREAEPFALVDVKGHLFIVDDRGKMLQELKESPIPFLPIISGDPFKKREIIHEALNLVKTIREQGLLYEKEHIEIIADELNEMSLNVDGVLVKIGTGDYDNKLYRLGELKAEIAKRNLRIDYIDLRFASRAIVKPIHEVIQ